MDAQRKKIFPAVAALLPESERISKTPEAFGLWVDSLVDGVLLKSPSGAFALLYAAAYSDGEVCVRGLSGYVLDGRAYTFDRIGVEDSWNPVEYDFSKQSSEWRLADAKTLASMMRDELARGEKALANRKTREAEGTRVNFGPTSRTLLPAEVEKYRKAIADGKGFSLLPSGFGTGYRFYSSTAQPLYGRRRPASKEARELLRAPRLVYDEIDCD